MKRQRPETTRREHNHEFAKLQPNLILPVSPEESDLGPLLRKYAEIAKIALDSPTPHPEDLTPKVA